MLTFIQASRKHINDGEIDLMLYFITDEAWFHLSRHVIQKTSTGWQKNPPVHAENQK